MRILLLHLQFSGISHVTIAWVQNSCRSWKFWGSPSPSRNVNIAINTVCYLLRNEHLHHNTYNKMLTASTLMIASAPNWKLTHAVIYLFIFIVIIMIFFFFLHCFGRTSALFKLGSRSCQTMKRIVSKLHEKHHYWLDESCLFPPFAVSLRLAVFPRVLLMSGKLEIIQSANGFSITLRQSERRRYSHINLAIKYKTGVWINIGVGRIKSTLIPCSDDVNESRNIVQLFNSPAWFCDMWRIKRKSLRIMLENVIGEIYSSVKIKNLVNKS